MQSSSHTQLTSEDHWLVESLALSALGAIAYLNTVGGNVIGSMLF